MAIRHDQLKTLNDFQKFLGDINWLRPFLKLTTQDLKSLFDILKGNPSPTSVRVLTTEGKKALQQVDKALTEKKLSQVDYTKPWQLIILKTQYTPTACLWQGLPLEWLHLPSTPRKVISSYPQLVALLITKGRIPSKELFGLDVQEIIIPYTRDQCDQLFVVEDQWAIALAGFAGDKLFHLPLHPLLHFMKTPLFLFLLDTLQSLCLPPQN